MPIIKLSAGHEIIVDEEDFDLSAMRWTSTIAQNGRFYGARYVRFGPRRLNKRKAIYLHRIVAERAGHKIDGLHVDHIDGDTANCRRSNLRAATSQMNSRNFGSLRVNNSSGFPGVAVSGGFYWATIRLGSKRLSLGRFKTAEAAYEARLSAEREHWGIEDRRKALHAELGA